MTGRACAIQQREWEAKVAYCKSSSRGPRRFSQITTSAEHVTPHRLFFLLYFIRFHEFCRPDCRCHFRLPMQGTGVIHYCIVSSHLAVHCSISISGCPHKLYCRQRLHAHVNTSRSVCRSASFHSDILLFLSFGITIKSSLYICRLLVCQCCRNRSRLCTSTLYPPIT